MAPRPLSPRRLEMLNRATSTGFRFVGGTAVEAHGRWGLPPLLRPHQPLRSFSARGPPRCYCSTEGVKQRHMPTETGSHLLAATCSTTNSWTNSSASLEARLRIGSIETMTTAVRRTSRLSGGVLRARESCNAADNFENGGLEVAQAEQSSLSCTLFGKPVLGEGLPQQPASCADCREDSSTRRTPARAGGLHKTSHHGNTLSSGTGPSTAAGDPALSQALTSTQRKPCPSPTSPRSPTSPISPSSPRRRIPTRKRPNQNISSGEVKPVPSPWSCPRPSDDGPDDSPPKAVQRMQEPCGAHLGDSAAQHLPPRMYKFLAEFHAALQSRSFRPFEEDDEILPGDLEGGGGIRSSKAVSQLIIGLGESMGLYDSEISLLLACQADLAGAVHSKEDEPVRIHDALRMVPVTKGRSPVSDLHGSPCTDHDGTLSPANLEQVTMGNPHLPQGGVEQTTSHGGNHGVRRRLIMAVADQEHPRFSESRGTERLVNTKEPRHFSLDESGGNGTMLNSKENATEFEDSISGIHGTSCMSEMPNCVDAGVQTSPETTDDGKMSDCQRDVVAKKHIILHRCSVESVNLSNWRHLSAHSRLDAMECGRPGLQATRYR